MVNRLTQIYTKTGDKGKTGLGDGTRVEKFSTRIECLGNVDELNSIIGLILTENVSQTNILKKIQHDLFDIGGELSIPNYKKIDLKKVNFLEQELDRMNEYTPSPKRLYIAGWLQSGFLLSFRPDSMQKG